MGQLKRMRPGWLERTLAGLAWVARQRGQNEAVAAHLATGIDGETAAFSYLRRKGYTVAARRWSSGDVPGDIDLIAWKGTMLCFVEVKTRTARDASPAEIAIDSHKRNTLRRLARRASTWSASILCRVKSENFNTLRGLLAGASERITRGIES